MALIVFVHIVGALLLPWLVNDAAEKPAPIGEIVGAEIVMTLVIWSAVVFLLKARRQRKTLAAVEPAF